MSLRNSSRIDSARHSKTVAAMAMTRVMMPSVVVLGIGRSCGTNRWGEHGVFGNVGWAERVKGFVRS